MAAPTCLLRRVARDRGVPRAPDESAERSPSPEGAPEARREAVTLTVLGIRSWRVQCTVPLFVASGCLSGAGLCGSGHEPPGESLPGAPEERAVSCAPGRLLGARAARAGAGISLWGMSRRVFWTAPRFRTLLSPSRGRSRPAILWPPVARATSNRPAGVAPMKPRVCTEP